MKPLAALLRLTSLVSILSLTACTTILKPDPRSTHYAAAGKLHLNVALNVTDELRNAKWEQKALTGGGLIMAVGLALAEDAPAFARSTFLDVVEINNGSAPPKPVDATLTPKMAFMGLDYGQTMFSADTVTLKLEWTLTDLAGNVLWADTITAEGRSAGGWPKDMRLAVERAFRKSQYVMLSARGIQQYVAKKYPELNAAPPPAALITNPQVKELCASLNAKDKGKVEDALKKLATLDAPEAVPEIIPCLMDGEPNVVKAASKTLAVLGNKDAVLYLEPLLKDKDVRKDAEDALTKLRAKSPR